MSKPSISAQVNAALLHARDLPANAWLGTGWPSDLRQAALHVRHHLPEDETGPAADGVTTDADATSQPELALLALLTSARGWRPPPAVLPTATDAQLAEVLRDGVRLREPLEGRDAWGTPAMMAAQALAPRYPGTALAAAAELIERLRALPGGTWLPESRRTAWAARWALSHDLPLRALAAQGDQGDQTDGDELAPLRALVTRDLDAYQAAPDAAAIAVASDEDLATMQARAREWGKAPRSPWGEALGFIEAEQARRARPEAHPVAQARRALHRLSARELADVRGQHLRNAADGRHDPHLDQALAEEDHARAIAASPRS